MQKLYIYKIILFYTFLNTIIKYNYRFLVQSLQLLHWIYKKKWDVLY